MRVEAWREGESGRAEGVQSEERAARRWVGGGLDGDRRKRGAGRVRVTRSPVNL
jgi:hypothetical protein